MFFYLSKILWIAAAPSNVLVLTALGGALATAWRPGPARRRWAIRVTGAAVLGLAVAGFSPAGTLLLATLESRFPIPDLTGVTPRGIIVLGGAVDEEQSARRGGVHLSEGAERMTMAVELARRFPDARLIFAGGSASLLSSTGTEAAYARDLWTSLGIPSDRILLENRSRNTDENARYTRDLLAPGPNDRYLLVTSAFHMPRAVALFRKAGLPVTPYPVDFRSPGGAADWRPVLHAAAGLYAFDGAIREWIGLIAYRLTGRTETILPSP